MFFYFQVVYEEEIDGGLVANEPVKHTLPNAIIEQQTCLHEIKSRIIVLESCVFESDAFILEPSVSFTSSIC